MDELIIRTPDDMHVHLRRGELLWDVLPFTARQFGRALVMPNTKPQGIFTAEHAVEYREEIQSVLDAERDSGFMPLMSIKLTDETTPAMILAAKAAGVVAGKVYPVGVTTHSADGVRDLKSLWNSGALGAMQDCGMLLLLHGEHPTAYHQDAEAEFLPILRETHARFPKLRIVLEHVSTAAAIQAVQELGPTVAATITIHHMMINGDDVVKGTLRPHLYCLPMAKRESDRQAVLQAALSGNPKFFLGTDSAPHRIASKEGEECYGGIFTAPVALPLLAQVFEDNHSLHALGCFCSVFGAQFYGLPLNEGVVRLARRSWPVEPVYGGVKPFYRGQSLRWSFVGKE